MLEAVFENTEQALHIAYLLEHIPASGKSVMQVVVETIKQKGGQSSSDPCSKVDFRGLSAVEIRGQCATIRQLVEDTLTDDEKNALWARYGWYETKGQGLAHLAVGLDSGLPDEALGELLCNIYRVRGYNRKGRAANPLSIRRIAEQHEVTESALKKAKRSIVSHVRKLEGEALGSLEVLFLSKGLITGA